MTGIEQALSPDREFLVGDNITLADICYVAELSLFSNEKSRTKVLEEKGLKPILHSQLENEFPRAIAHFSKLCKHSAFAPDVQPYLRKLETRE
jgi:elongation factor 1-gamma